MANGYGELNRLCTRRLYHVPDALLAPLPSGTTTITHPKELCKVSSIMFQDRAVLPYSMTISLTSTSRKPSSSPALPPSTSWIEKPAPRNS